MTCPGRVMSQYKGQRGWDSDVAGREILGLT